MFSEEQRRAYSARAARLLLDGDVDWRQTEWVSDYETGERLDPNLEMRSVRRWLNKYGVGTQNRRCAVCAEGALILALAEDPNVPDTVSATTMLQEFQADAAQAAVELEYIDDRDYWEGIAHLNDELADSSEMVVGLLDRMSRL